jgi:hypothetical protein
VSEERVARDRPPRASRLRHFEKLIHPQLPRPSSTLLTAAPSVIAQPLAGLGSLTWLRSSTGWGLFLPPRPTGVLDSVE